MGHVVVMGVTTWVGRYKIMGSPEFYLMVTLRQLINTANTALGLNAAESIGMDVGSDSIRLCQL